jgi:lipopolysaccharide assembly outer membrane protein LptD (OstA)
MPNTLLRKLLALCLFATLLAPAQVVCPQNAVKPTETTSSKPKPQPPADGKPQDKQGKDAEDDRVVIEHVDNLKYDSAAKMYYLRGNVVFANKDVRLHCDEADYNEQADTAKARGHLRITDPNSIVTGDLLEADFGKELAIVTGNVTIVTQKRRNAGQKVHEGPALAKTPKGKPVPPNGGGNKAASAASRAGTKPKQGGEPERMEDYWEKKTTVTCERLEYYYGEDVKRMTATPRVKAVQEDKTVWADQAVYEDIPRLVTLTGNVVLTTEKGDEMRCAKAVISLDEDWVEAEGMSGVTLRKGKKEPAPTEPKPEPQPAQTAPAAAPAPAADQSGD